MKNLSKISVLVSLILLTACAKDDNPESIYSPDLSLLKSQSKILRNQDILFQLMDGESDITEDATFYVNNTPIVGNVFSTSNTGIYNVRGEYEGMSSAANNETNSFEVYIPRKKVLIEGFTGTWCPPCILLDYKMNNAYDSIVDVVGVKLHTGSRDPFVITETNELGEHFGVYGVPWGVIDRSFQWNYFSPPQLPLDELRPYAGIDTDLSIKINSESTGSNLNLDINIISEHNISGAKLIVYLVEDGLIYEQANAYNNDPDSPYYNLGDPIPNFVHNDVLRMSITNIFGDEIPLSPALMEYDKSFSINIPEEYKKENLKIVATVIGEDDFVRNTQVSKINQVKDYE